MDKQKHLKQLFEFLAIPSISAQKEHRPDMVKAANWLKNKLLKLGFKAKVLPTAGHPVVYAENIGNKNKPTILIYGHYDVQAPDPLDKWQSAPFAPEVRNGNIYGRGTADDKGQLYTWLVAIEAVLKKNKKLPVNIKFLIEGEEELGSLSLGKFIEENQNLLRADICIISDSHCLSKNQPLITYGLRGLAYMEVRVKTLAQDGHSGLYGGNVLNPAIVLAQIIAKLKDENHKIKIPGFYANVRKLTPKERQKLAKFPFGKKEVLQETGAKTIAGETGFNVIERAGARPTLDVNGIWGGYQEEGQKTIIPAEAGAKISMRLVPNQNSDEIVKKFTKYVRQIAPVGAQVEMEKLSGGEPILMHTDSQYFQIAEKAYQEVFGKKPLYELSGGSIPVTAILKKLLRIDSLLMGYGLPDDGLHSPNEKLSLEMFEKGIKTNIEFLKLLQNRV